MPLITPFAAPPLTNLSNHTGESTILIHNTQMNTSNVVDLQTETSAENTGNNSTRKIPRVRVDVDTIPDMMAAKLATSLLGHVLFLKNQIPFPIVQLSRLPGGKSNPRTEKLKRDLIDSFDTLSSHLDTTFTALSTAFARCSQTAQSTSDADNSERKFSNPAYMAILVGPSIGTAKSKIIFAVDSLETKIWGLRNDLPPKVDVQEEESSESSPEDGEGLEETHADSDSDDENSHSGPEDSDSESETDSCSTSSHTDSPIPPPRSQHTDPSTSSPSASYLQDHAREQQKIRVADQLLSRTLAIADAEGRGMACELAPTQTHILLRAPRRFAHPAWVPRLNFTNSLEHTLTDFLEETRLFIDVTTEEKTKNKRTQRQTVEGVWVAGRTVFSDTLSTQSSPASNFDKQETVNQIQDEADEMIWWSWDGKIVGFSGW
ncbi:hypothetical protein GGU10DRAFT_341908 [Lentinula aff. detonsa]|uniref:Uncharacterized protein n=1 Tax=Lentinula aff. detonsa TaxID=2804958 RepID=A0AA38TZE6_9AGAR|nr:hypothetical protein GGU10DRAFT_341908 [Lentinula aff. detonsa]